jgi:PKD repeat protein
MKHLHFLFLTAAIFLIATSGFSQQLINYQNADGILLAKKIIENPSVVQKYKAYEDQMKQIIEQIKNDPLVNGKGTKTDTLIDGKRVIPVVFHIIHNYGPENISDAQIIDAVEKINIDYQKQNADTADTYPMFQSRAANCNIEFRLAKIDPNGNCTNGIERIYDPRTEYAYFSVMHDYCWTPSHYMNIFCVDFIYPEGINLPAGAFIGGMSPFPPSNSLTQLLTGGDTLMDGVLIRQDCIGSIGTATNMGGMGINAINRTFTHESGHYFNLYHPFNTGILCTLFGYDGCGSEIMGCGDEVADTPPVQVATQNTSTNCFTPGSRNTCSNDSPDEPDMIENYMDYQWGFCTNIFTTGQKDRIDATFTADRAKLWTKENLIATGVLDPNTYLCSPIADFNVNYKMICAGSSVTFTDFSYNGVADSWEWTFSGGTPATSTDQNPTITYNTAGTYSVTLKAINASGSDSLTKQDLIIVSDPAVAQDAPFTEGFETNINSWLNYNMDGNPWVITDSAEYSGAKSLYISNFSGNYPNSTDEIILPAIDFTAFTPVPSTLQMKFKLAYTGKTVTNTLTGAVDTIWDYLKVLVSRDCGKTWQIKYSKTGTTLATTALTDVRFFPASVAEWREETVNLTAFIPDDNVRIKFQFSSGGGNNIFIDDINIEIPTAIEELAETIGLSIYPNPLTESTVLAFNLEEKENVEIEILDLLGKQIATVSNEEINAGIQKISLSKELFGSAGFYFVKLTVGGESLMQKVIVQ